MADVDSQNRKKKGEIRVGKWLASKRGSDVLISLLSSGNELRSSFFGKEFVRIESKFQMGCSVRGGCGNSTRAFTLMETVVATLLLTLAIVALYAAFSFGFGTIKLTQEDVQADQILVQKLETLRVYDWSKITNGYIPANLTASFSTNGSMTYDVAIEVTPAPVIESYRDTLRQVTVSLSWDSGGVLRNRSMTTFVSKDGLQTYKP